jgi:hypothetical protein
MIVINLHTKAHENVRFLFLTQYNLNLNFYCKIAQNKIGDLEINL